MGVMIVLAIIVILVGIGYISWKVKRLPETDSERGGGGKSTDESGTWYPAKVAGVTYENDDGSSRQGIIAKCVEGEELELIREPDNVYDPLATKVCRINGEQLGYVESDFAGNVARAIDEEHKTPKARVKALGKKDGTRYCVIEVNFKGAQQ